MRLKPAILQRIWSCPFVWLHICIITSWYFFIHRLNSFELRIGLRPTKTINKRADTRGNRSPCKPNVICGSLSGCCVRIDACWYVHHEPTNGSHASAVSACLLFLQSLWPYNFHVLLSIRAGSCAHMQRSFWSSPVPLAQLAYMPQCAFHTNCPLELPDGGPSVLVACVRPCNDDAQRVCT